jgi:hypothetical protein
LEWKDICGCFPCTGLSWGPPGHADRAFFAVSETHTPPEDDELLAATGAGGAAAGGGGAAALDVLTRRRAPTTIHADRTRFMYVARELVPMFITTSRTST